MQFEVLTAPLSSIYDSVGLPGPADPRWIDRTVEAFDRALAQEA